MKILWNRVPLEKALKNDKLSLEQKEKLQLASKAKDFSQESLGLVSNGNYSSFVALKRDAVTYVVQVAYADKLKSHKWNFPFVGKVPYKGYFKKELAEKEAKKFSTHEYDTWIRGVKAYSTLGWFKDPVTSPMLTYREVDLVETIIHELVHTTIYLKDQADFNERLATFIGIEGAKIFYTEKEGRDSPTKIQIELEQKDLHLFSKFITDEISKLRSWYQDHNSEEIKETKENRILEIQERFDKKLKPHLHTEIFSHFSKIKLNNAILMSYDTYVSDLSEFEDLYEKLKRDLPLFIKVVTEKLKNSKNPSSDLKALSINL